MASFLSGDSSNFAVSESSCYRQTEDKEEGGSWYFSRKEIEENSPSKVDGIDLKKEAYLRKSYCTFLQDLGMRLKVPQVTIATAIIFCHRFYVCQSHAKNDRRTIATVCMFLAGKVEETPRPLKDVILVSYEIIHKKDPAAAQRIKQKEVYEQQKELILTGERVVLGTLAFDFNVHHPYKPLVEAIKKFKVAQNALAQVAWNFVNDGLRTSLCLQFKPHHIAAGAIFLAAKFLKVKLPSDGEKVWWQEFDVTPRQLEEVSNQMLELYEQNRFPSSDDVEGTVATATKTKSRMEHQDLDHGSSVKIPASHEATSNSHLQAGGTRSGTSRPASRPASEQSYVENDYPARTSQSQNNDYRSAGMTGSLDQNMEVEDNHHPKVEEAQNVSRFVSEGRSEEGQERESNDRKGEIREGGDKHFGRNLDNSQSALGRSPQEAIKKIDKDKVRAALEKRRKATADMTRKTDLLDEDDLIERELEDGIELAGGSEKNKRDRRQSWSKSSHRQEHESLHQGKHREGVGDGGPRFSTIEEGEVSAFEAGHEFPSPKSSSRKRKEGSPLEIVAEKKQRHDYRHNHFDHTENHNRVGRVGHTERDNKRPVQENHV
ncbi:putative cyclin [Rosa chinensis]|uniref:B-like cyclin n=1 Tax=Rosa chinensis TaxID=74649 RepID=A0A2P6Q8T8_ROSCH|nr:cyclin-T1-3 [Rosa chinensis]XP_024156461.1 cyclin-T1-3 [Rosa chinensis]XP_024156462.1 cyclin-T1-3 [Rosa chinensis]XP_040362176.1 cyclin-T1-3 [Rosa chinensis]PRQ30574.1 putative cyclin [Rosa chinensis]